MFREKSIKINLGNAVPQSSGKLKQIRALIRDYAAENELVPPLLEEEVIHHSGEIIKRHPELFLYQKMLAVMINNYCWKHIVEGIPYDRRILLLPKCMSHSTDCPAKVDELGLLCEQCGRCHIGGIISKAEELGYHVIVSEGTTPVTMLLASGKVECVIGVGCLHSFERSFPIAVKEAVPSIAIPLFNSNCKDSRVDEEWLNELLPIRSESNWNGWIDLKRMQEDVKGWFFADNLEKLFGSNETTTVANQWLEAGGKRWRPLIMVAVYKALCGNYAPNAESIMKLAVAVEAFHKASLVHDDIADGDQERYGKPTLHEQYNIPVALNIGDLLTGFGYQMIAESDLDGNQVKKLLTIAAHGHRDLSLGQGEELLWRRTSKTLSVHEILRIFSNKTAPAFDVALKFGAIVSESSDSLMEILSLYSKALGIAYQIKDDLDDFTMENSAQGLIMLQPSLIIALLGEKFPEETQKLLRRIEKGDFVAVEELHNWSETQQAIQDAHKMLEEYKQKALSVLMEIRNPSLKILLVRLLNKII
ncbi:MAG: polyprenyl synthetase family protein [Marinifilaceae bacterium]